MTEPAITILPAAPLHALEIWSSPREAAARCEVALGIALPEAGGSAVGAGLTLMRFEPTVWLVEGNVAPLRPVLDDDGALTAIGGGIARVRIAGAGWRTLLMEGGLFDAESPAFATGRTAATIIDHVPVRLFVESEAACLAYLPASYARALIGFWTEACSALDLT